MLNDWTPVNRETEVIKMHTVIPLKHLFVPKSGIRTNPPRALHPGQFGYVFPQGKDHQGPQAGWAKAERRQLARAKRQAKRQAEGSPVGKAALMRIARLRTRAQEL